MIILVRIREHPASHQVTVFMRYPLGHERNQVFHRYSLDAQNVCPGRYPTVLFPESQPSSLEKYSGFLDFADDSDFIGYEIEGNKAILHLNACIMNEKYKSTLDLVVIWGG